MIDTRYKKGVVWAYAELMAEEKGGNAADYVDRCLQFVDEHKDWHERNRWDFTPKEGFLEQI